MREIKFRQAIFKTGMFDRWHYWGFVGYKNEFVGPIEIQGINNIYDTKESQEFTGLLDESGKEIYEGDILQIAASVFIIKSEVFWEEELTGFYINTDEDGYNWEPLGTYLTKAYEIIGNIYENPELLEE